MQKYNFTICVLKVTLNKIGLAIFQFETLKFTFFYNKIRIREKREKEYLSACLLFVKHAAWLKFFQSQRSAYRSKGGRGRGHYCDIVGIPDAPLPIIGSRPVISLKCVGLYFRYSNAHIAPFTYCPVFCR